ncbi:MAG: D-alanyl-D-alanine dipeptidase [Bacteroidetes bacterium]|nr:MAG: D-alanyl-D-alanine dipeptidase [Bacteroidota bacterium]MCB0802054.1 M15 family metallopeptidase [Flavobacteriales bacterium]
MKFLFLILMMITSSVYAQKNNKYGVESVSDKSIYFEQLQNDSTQHLVDLTKIQGLFFDIRYATKNNFTGSVVYPQIGAFARAEVAKALKAISQEINKNGLALLIYDAYRPYDATVKFYELYKDTNYVASPYSGSRHNRGCAIDLTLIDLISKKPLNMPTPYDDFTEQAHPTYEDLPENAKNNRDFLINIMDKHGFDVYKNEWWHFDFRGWEQYPIMNLSFETLKNIQ